VPDGKVVLLSDGPAIDAVIAAASIPAVLRPVRNGAHRKGLQDGS
jgi:predicted acylesterase/phospholipase RssA